MSLYLRPRTLGMVFGVFALAAGCGGQGSLDTAAASAPLPTVVEMVDLDSCLTINPTGPVTTPPSEPCLAHGVALDGFHEGARLMEFADYRPDDAAEIAAEIRTVVRELEVSHSERSPDDRQLRDERATALEAVAVAYDEIHEAFSLRAPGVESSYGANAAYIEVVTRDLWERYFATFFDGPGAQADAAHVVERVFVRLRGFELD